MASQRDIRRRIASVHNTRKITKAMEMVAAARLRRAQQRIEATRPYALNMLEFIGQLVNYLQVDLSLHPLLKPHAHLKKVAVIALTADRGMCGAFNANIVRRALDRVNTYAAEGVESDLVVMGRKGVSTVRFQGYKIDRAYLDVTERTAFLEAQALTNGVIRRYANESIDRVHLVFNRFKSPMEQFVTDQVILPIQEEITGQYCPADAQEHMDFLFEPDPETILADLLPSYVEITIYRAILEGMASEHGARMTAMRAASEAADEMINDLTLAMNRVRQASITQEILEVVAGADALSG
ncbi:MAG: ATP synthase F1 subunit gamma [Actinobacteria bacterium RBG_16_64_13]|nr:MAG: ATP synthase F1 subunit gamma [Actinobacteria bacterium RBG_16_64_13]